MLESLRLYLLYKAYNVLPEPGGTYDQDPLLFTEWQLIQQVEREEEEKRPKRD